jgi:hypothetical protein
MTDIGETEKEVHAEGNSDIRGVAVIESEEGPVEVGPHSESMNQGDRQADVDHHRSPAYDSWAI